MRSGFLDGAPQAYTLTPDTSGQGGLGLWSIATLIQRRQNTFRSFEALPAGPDAVCQLSFFAGTQSGFVVCQDRGELPTRVGAGPGQIRLLIRSLGNHQQAISQTDTLELDTHARQEAQVTDLVIDLSCGGIQLTHFNNRPHSQGLPQSSTPAKAEMTLERMLRLLKRPMSMNFMNRFSSTMGPNG
jgi:hypothetical protein